MKNKKNGEKSKNKRSVRRRNDARRRDKKVQKDGVKSVR